MMEESLPAIDIEDPYRFDPVFETEDYLNDYLGQFSEKMIQKNRFYQWKLNKNLFTAVAVVQ